MSAIARSARKGDPLKGCWWEVFVEHLDCDEGTRRPFSLPLFDPVHFLPQVVHQALHVSEMAAHPVLAAGHRATARGHVTASLDGCFFFRGVGCTRLR